MIAWSWDGTEFGPIVAADPREAAARAADLLVLGSHGHSRVRQTVLGSVSADCIRKATCPVVVIPVPVHEAGPADVVVRT